MLTSCTVRRIAAALALGAVLAACSGGSAAPANTITPAPASGNANNGNAGGDTTAGGGGEAAAAGGEAPSLRFVSSRNHYRVDAPGTMTESSDGTATASHGTESLTITVASGSTAADPGAYARSDLDSQRSRSGFALKSGPSGFPLSASSSAVKTVYLVSGATNPVTGKAQSFVTVRYYVPRNASTLAVLTYSIVQSQYDPQGADDVANTFAWQ
jgi:hypothetical protein